jgi:hypothetical protein
MQDALTVHDIVDLGGLEPVLPRGLAGLNHCMRQTVAEVKVCLVRMQDLPQDAVIASDEFFAVFQFAYEHSFIPPYFLATEGTALTEKSKFKIPGYW